MVAKNHFCSPIHFTSTTTNTQKNETNFRVRSYPLVQTVESYQTQRIVPVFMKPGLLDSILVM